MLHTIQAIQDPSGFIVTTHGVLWTAAALVLLGTCIEVCRRVFIKPIMVLVHRLTEFLDDWQGTPDRPGVPGRKGVMARLSSVEADKVDKAEFRELAAEVAEKATKEELAQLQSLLVYASDIERQGIPRTP